jgi:prepilin-type N-terminal cleavage/methylation domain-containing protein
MNKKGHTLIELILVVVILGIIGVFTFLFVDRNIRTYLLIINRGEIYQEASYTLERITRELRDASYVPMCGTGMLAFQKGNPRNGEVVTWYSISNSRLYRTPMSNWTTPISDPKLMSENVGVFRCESAPDPQTGDEPTFQLTLTLVKQGAPSLTMSTKVCPKNYCGGVNSPTCSTGYAGRSFNKDYVDVVE